VATVGELALWVALFFAVWGSVAAFGAAAAQRVELVESAVRSIRASTGMTALACLGLLAALLSHDLSLQYVVAHTTLNTPTLYLITALWAGPAGAMLSFAFALSVCSAAALWRRRTIAANEVAWVVGAVSGVLALVLVALCFMTNPYDRVEWVPAEGQGLDPRLQSLLAAPYYASTYAAYGAAAIPFARGVGAVWDGGTDQRWVASVRSWTLVTWFLFTFSLALRMRWTYLEPMTRGLWKVDLSQGSNVAAWVLALLLLSFAARGRFLSPRLVAALAFSIFCFALVGAAAIPRPPRAGGGSEASSTALLALAGFGVLAAAVIYWAVRRIPAARPYHDLVAPGRLPIVAVFTGLAMVIVGIAAANWRTSTTRTLRPGAPTELTDPYGSRWRFVSQGVSRDERVNYLTSGVALEAWRDGRQAGIISAERRQYFDSVQRPIGEPALRAGVRAGLGLDVYVVLMEVGSDSARLQIEFRPLISFVWIGWLVVAMGGIGLGRAPRPSRAAEIGVLAT
jgi:cytochrome c biogenesis factor